MIDSIRADKLKIDVGSFVLMMGELVRKDGGSEIEFKLYNLLEQDKIPEAKKLLKEIIIMLG